MALSKRLAKRKYCIVLNGNLELIKWLVEKGLDVNAKDKDEKTPLIFAAENQNGKVIE